MLPIEEFRLAIDLYRKRMSAGLVVAIVSSMAYMACFGLLRDLYSRWFDPAAAEILMGLSPAPAVILVFGSFWLIGRKAKNDPRLICPSCGKSLDGMSSIVVATRNCGHCGKRVLAEPASPDL